MWFFSIESSRGGKFANRWTLSTVALLATLWAAPAATALASSPSPLVSHPTYANTEMTVKGSLFARPKHLLVVDPWSGSKTSALPMYYVE